jgi:hypothetical protein
MSIRDQIREIERQRLADVERERIVRDAAFLGLATERIAGYPAAALTLRHCNLLRLMGSPFMPPFETPGPKQLAAFLWVVNPGFIAGTDRKAIRARDRFFKTCRVFVKPSPPIFGLTYKIKRWEAQAGEALKHFTEVVTAARAYMEEALQDRPPSDGGNNGPDYYSDFCHIAGALMRNYHGLSYELIQRLPVKVIYQFLKEIREHNALSAGDTPVMWNGSDMQFDRILELLNTPGRN